MDTSTWAGNDFWLAPRSWDEAAAMVSFTPFAPTHTAGYDLEALRVHKRLRKRELAMTERTLEAHYGGFVLSQKRAGMAEATRLALEVSYGRNPFPAWIRGHEGRAYEKTDVEPADEAMPSVVTWSDGDMHLLLASPVLETAALLGIAASVGRAATRRTSR